MRFRNIAANALTVLIVAGLVGAVAFAWAEREFVAPGPLQEEAIVEVPRGASLREVAQLLEMHGVIESGMLFRLGARYTERAQRLKFGEYAFEPGASMEEVLAKLATGDVIMRFVTVPEGRSSWEVVQILQDNPLLTGEVDVPPEGSVFPSTYDVRRNQPRSEVLERMQAAMDEKLAVAWEKRQEGLPIETPEEALILASIVEKETGLSGERAEVAGVFINRLRKGMRLQSDPTVVYGITEGKGPLGRGLRRSELDRETPYNTYAIDGLPPTPIANPGLEAIEAVLNPAETDALYFVADGTGGHVFAETLDEHNANVRQWRKIEAERQAAAERETAVEAE